jgi:predicted PurR-regulated permease PerM
MEISEDKPRITRAASIWQVLVPVACFVVIVAGMKAASTIIVPFLLAAFLAVVFSPLLFWLRKRGVRAGFAVLLVVLLLLIAGIAVVYLAGSSVEEFARRVPRYTASLQDQVRVLVQALNQRGWDVKEAVVTEYLNPSVIMRMIGNTVASLAAALTNLFLIILTVIFMLMEASLLPAKLRSVLNTPEARMEWLTEFMNNFNRYLAIKTVFSLVTGLAAGVLLWILGIDFPVLWGLLAFVLNYVPNIGSIIAAIPPILLALILRGPGWAVLTGVGYLVINMIFGNILEPRFMGRRLGLSTLVVFFSLVFWGWVLGPVGMLISVPLTMVVKLALESYEDTRWLSILLSSNPPVGSKV